MPNNNLKNSSEPTGVNIKKIAIITTGVAVVCLIAITVLILLNASEQDPIQNRINELAKKTKQPSFERTIDKVASSANENELDLPIIDQAELKRDYQNNLQEIMADLDQEIKLAGGVGALAVQTTQQIKDRIMKEVVPVEYQDLHIDLVLTLDLIIEGDFTQAESKLESIKSRI